MAGAVIEDETEGKLLACMEDMVQQVLNMCNVMMKRVRARPSGTFMGGF